MASRPRGELGVFEDDDGRLRSGYLERLVREAREAERVARERWAEVTATAERMRRHRAALGRGVRR